MPAIVRWRDYDAVKSFAPVEIRPGSPADFAAFLVKEKKQWDGMASEAHITMN
jgi:hypothetical protein